jgi:dynein heavy chain
MKDSLKKINKCLENFNVKIIERKNRPMNPDDYDQYLKGIVANKLGIVKENGASIHKLLKEVIDAVKADKKSNQWTNYQNYVNSIVIDGLSSSIQTALRHLIEQIDP